MGAGCEEQCDGLGKVLLGNQHADVCFHTLRDFRDLLLTSWRQSPQHTFMFWAGISQVVIVFGLETTKIHIEKGKQALNVAFTD